MVMIISMLMKHKICKALPMVIVFTLAVGIFLSGCRSAKVVVAPPELSRQQVWRLVEMHGSRHNPGSAPITIVFNAEAGTVRGRAVCNTYNADYTLSALSVSVDDAYEWCGLKITGIESGSVQCPEAEMNAEARYLAKLRQCNQLAVIDAGNTLVLGVRNKPVLRFELTEQTE